MADCELCLDDHPVYNEDLHVQSKAFHTLDSHGRVSGAGTYAEAGVSRIMTETKEVKAEAKGPNASAKAQISKTEGSILATTEVASVSCKANTDAAGVLFDIAVLANGPSALAGANFGKKGGSAMLTAEVASVSCNVSVDVVGVSTDMEVLAKGPNVSAGAECGEGGVRTMARAELASISSNVGMIGTKIGIGVDTGFSVSLNGIEGNFLGTGLSFGPKTRVSVLGTEINVDTKKALNTVTSWF